MAVGEKTCRDYASTIEGVAQYATDMHRWATIMATKTVNEEDCTHYAAMARAYGTIIHLITGRDVSEVGA